MAKETKIEWTEVSWNPITGCTKISDGCLNCYALRMAKRLKAMKNPRYKNGFGITIHEDLFDLPLTWKKPKRIFVNSMSDLFHENIADEYIKRIFAIMNEASWHTFQVLTKRSKRLRELSNDLLWSKNIWMGVTVENKKATYRINDLKKVPASIKFLSLEPLLEPLPFIDLEGINWVIVGGESGPNARPIKLDWVRQIRDKCTEQSVPFFFKQWGGVFKHKSGRILDGITWNEYPS